MGFLFDLLTAPVLGPARLVHWLGKELAQEAEHQYLDLDGVRAGLLELQGRRDMGEIGEEEYAEQERALEERLRALGEG